MIFWKKNEIDYKQIKNPILKISVIETLACCKLNLGATLECRNHLIECINIPYIKEYLPHINYLHTIKRLGIVEFELGNYKNSYRYLSSVASENYLVLGMNFCCYLEPQNWLIIKKTFCWLLINIKALFAIQL